MKVGTVIEDTYGNPAVVLRLDHQGQPSSIMQTVGSDLGRVTYVPGIIREITGDRAEAARQRARAEWARRGYKRSQFGIAANTHVCEWDYLVMPGKGYCRACHAVQH